MALPAALPADSVDAVLAEEDSAGVVSGDAAVDLAVPVAGAVPEVQAGAAASSAIVGTRASGKFGARSFSTCVTLLSMRHLFR